MHESQRDDEDEGRIVDEPQPTNGLFCFLNETRECGPDCMAFTKDDPDDVKRLSSQQKNCTLLVSVDRLGRYTGMLATVANRLQKESADRVRISHAPPPDPLGKRS